ncbi:MAG TPA: sigma-70 family RNA polymerase sigma factor [Pyrinomonadaceae bacterium]|jgi:RNA polymerase sigma factor (TIGR02999 family)
MNQVDRTKREITQILQELSDGKRDAVDRLIPLVYEELRRQAARYLRRERPDHTLQATAIVHEAYLKLIDQTDVKWESRTHFFAIAAQAMRRILVDHARTKHREKRGGDAFKVTFDDALPDAAEEKSVDLIALDEVLTKLEAKDKQQARVVELRYFAGLSLEETADALDISRATAARDWKVAKAWLHRELTR